jgi:hypothetical protein
MFVFKEIELFLAGHTLKREKGGLLREASTLP